MRDKADIKETINGLELELKTETHGLQQAYEAGFKCGAFLMLRWALGEELDEMIETYGNRLDPKLYKE